MAVFQGQTSYDPRFIRKLFPGKDTYKHPALAQLFGVDLDKLDNLPADKYKLFEEVSSINHLTKDDPPVLLSYRSAFDAEVTSVVQVAAPEAAGEEAEPTPPPEVASG